MSRFRSICSTFKKQLLRIWFFRSISNRRNDNSLILKKRSVRRKVGVFFYGKHNKFVVADNCKFLKKITVLVFGDNNLIEIGINNTFGGGSFWIEGNNNSLIIGKNNVFAGQTLCISLVEGYMIKIGNDNLFSENIDIRNGDSHGIYDSFSNKRINDSCNLVIGNHNWICRNVTILKNGSIGQDIVVANNSVVTKDFVNMNNIIIGGVPANILKQNIKWSVGRSDIYENN